MMDEKTPMVSIDCMVYNHEAYLRAALDGFVMQQTNFPFEVLIHEDKSTDTSKVIIEEYRERYPEIIKPLYRKKNVYSRSKNFYLVDKAQRERAMGKYYAFCEGDDYWTDPHKLQKQVDFMEANPDYNLCFHDCKVWNETDECFEPSWMRLEKSCTVSMKDFFRKKVEAPTLSIMTRTSSYCLSGHVAKWAPVRDYPGVLLALHYGKAYYMKECMGVYRMNRPGCWSLFNRNWNFYWDTCWRYLRFLKMYNQFTEYKYRTMVYRKQVKYVRYFIKKTFLLMIFRMVSLGLPHKRN